MEKNLTLVIGDKQLSSWSLRPWLTLKMSGLSFTEKMIKLDTPEFHREIVAYSPNHRVPALLVNKQVIWESLAICEFLADLTPALWPQDLYVRAHARSISHEMHAGFQTLRTYMPMKFASTGLTPKQNDAKLDQDIQRIFQIWTDCRTTYSGHGPFLFGAFSIADAMYAPVVSRFRSYGITLSPILQKYAETMWNLAPMQAWLKGAQQEI